ncbi:MAG: NAD-dependent epimerase/dehydratase family protein [gamma proteobacterium symbiont of Phacoides pectinatus]
MISSRSLYPTGTSLRNREDDPIAPSDVYGMHKLAVEDRVRRIGKRNPYISACSLRLSRLYGLADGMRWTEVPHAFAQRLFRAGHPAPDRGCSERGGSAARPQRCRSGHGTGRRQAQLRHGYHPPEPARLETPGGVRGCDV